MPKGSRHELGYSSIHDRRVVAGIEYVEHTTGTVPTYGKCQYAHV